MFCHFTIWCPGSGVVFDCMIFALFHNLIRILSIIRQSKICLHAVPTYVQDNLAFLLKEDGSYYLC